MALKPCKSCKHQVDTSAKLCPSCGVAEPGVTIGEKAIGLFVLLIIIAVMFSMCSGGSGSSKENRTEVTQPDKPKEYVITKDDFREGMPRKVEVMLPKRISEAELAAVAHAVRDDTKFKPKTTFIGFRVDGQTSESYWSNANFTPEYRSSLYGLNPQDYESLRILEPKGYVDVVGDWLNEDPYGYVMVLYGRNGIYAIDSIYPDGSKSTKIYRGKKLPDGALRLNASEESSDSYYVVDEGGDLQIWGEHGLFKTLPPRISAI